MRRYLRPPSRNFLRAIRTFKVRYRPYPTYTEASPLQRPTAFRNRGSHRMKQRRARPSRPPRSNTTTRSCHHALVSRPYVGNDAPARGGGTCGYAIFSVTRTIRLHSSFLGKYEMPLMITDRASIPMARFISPSRRQSRHPPVLGPGILWRHDPRQRQDWPNMKVERRQYRFRIVDGSNARFYNLRLSNGMSFIQIGADGSYLPAPATLTESLTRSVSERTSWSTSQTWRPERRSSCRTLPMHPSRAEILPIRTRGSSCNSRCSTRRPCIRSPCPPR